MRNSARFSRLHATVYSQDTQHTATQVTNSVTRNSKAIDTISGSGTQTFIYAVTLHRKRVRPLGPPPIVWLSVQARRRMVQCSAWSYVTVEAVSTC